MYEFEGLAYKQNATQREFDMFRAAGDCAVQAVGRVMKIADSDSGRPIVSGILTELQTLFDFKSIATKDKATVSKEMIFLVQTLQDRYGVVHGDLKPANLLRCYDGKLRLCDFDSARLVDECPEAWEGLVSDRYLAPN
jgi:serine/threonine protein kinase